MDYNFTRTHNRLTALLLAIAIFAMVVPVVMAQSLITGDIIGTAVDPTSAVVPNAAVTLKSLDTGATQTTRTNATGFYHFPLLKPGRYEISIKQAGFGELKQMATVQVGQTTTANLNLTVSQSSETIEVTGEAPVVTPAASVNTSFSQTEVRELPSAGGDITNIAQTAPGSVPNGQGGYGNFTSNGLPATSNLFTVNGENDMDPYFNINNSGATNLTLGNNEVQEATVVTNPYSGEYGQLAGAQVSYVTKSGTNAYHGNAQYWWNGRAINANGWMNKGSQIAAGVPNQAPFSNANQWAASFGGPIRKNSTFFFLDTEGLRVVLPNTDTVFVPTPAFATAVLNNIATVQPAELPAYQTMFKLFANAKGAGTAQPVSLANGGGCGGLTTAFQGFDPNTTPCTASYQATPSALSTQWIFSGRLDQNIGNNDKAFFRYRMDRGLQATTLDPISSAFNATSNQPASDGQFQETHVFGPHLTNSFTASLSHYVALFQQDAALVKQTFPYAIETTGTVQLGWEVAAGGFYGFNTQEAFPQGRNFTQYQFIDDISWNRGNHTFKFGANFHRYDVSDHNFFYSNPRVYFGFNSAGMTNFINGLAYQYRQADNPVSNVPVALWYLGGYAQDEWNATSNLKLTFALRLERNSNPVCQVNCFANFKTSWNNLPSTMAGVNSGNVPYTNDIAFNQHTAFPGVDAVDLSPRFGFSWSPRSSKTLVISGGFGVFYDSPAAGLLDDLLGNPPVSTTFRVRPSSGTLAFDPGPNGSAATYQASAAAFSSGFAGGQTYSQISSNLAALGVVFAPPAFTSVTGTIHAPRWQEWNLQIQKEINPATAVVIGYNGNHGLRIPYGSYWPNAYDQYGIYPGVAGVAQSLPNTNYGTVEQVQSGAISNYNGLTVTVRRQLSRWVAGHFNYTWSHNMDETSNGGLFTYGDSILTQICPTSLRACNYGSSDYDARHNVSADFVVTPRTHFGNKFMNAALGDWTWSGKMFFHTGLPFSVTDNNTALGNYSGSLMGLPLVAGGAPGMMGTCGASNASSVGTANPCLNANDFFDINTSPAFPSLSALRRNQYRGPGYFDFDMSLFKNIRLTERFTFALGAQAFNIFNHPNFNNPDSGFGDTTFGQISTMVNTPTSPYGTFLGFDASPRVLQLSMKLLF